MRVLDAGHRLGRRGHLSPRAVVLAGAAGHGDDRVDSERARGPGCEQGPAVQRERRLAQSLFVEVELAVVLGRADAPLEAWARIQLEPVEHLVTRVRALPLLPRLRYGGE